MGQICVSVHHIRYTKFNWAVTGSPGACQRLICHVILAALEELLYMIARLWVNYNLYILIKYKGYRAPKKPSMAGEDRVPETTTKAIFGGLSTWQG